MFEDGAAHVERVAVSRARRSEDVVGREGLRDERGLMLEDFLKTHHVGILRGENANGAIEIAPKVHADALLDVPTHDAQIRHT